MGIRISKHIGLFIASIDIPDDMKENISEVSEDEDFLTDALNQTIQTNPFNTPYYCGKTSKNKIQGYECFMNVLNVDDNEGLLIKTPFQESLSRRDCKPENYLIKNIEFTSKKLQGLPYYCNNDFGFELSAERDFFTTFLQNLQLPLELLNKSQFSTIYTFG